MRRHAILASVSKRPADSVATPEGTERLMKDTALLVRRAARRGADILAFPEVYPQLSASPCTAYAEPEDGGTLQAVCDLARQYKIYLIWPRYERAANGQLYNSAILIDRAGAVVGRYHKMFPTIGEMEEGVTPADRCPVFETDFGRVAMIICFDLNFIEVRDALRKQQPDVVFFSSMYRGGIQCHEWAFDMGSYFVSAIAAELGRIIDRGGKLLQLSTYEALITQRVNLNTRQLHIDYNMDYSWVRMDEMLDRYGPELTFEYYTPEARFVLGYEREDRDVDDIVCEFRLEPVGPYFERAREFRQKKLKP